jgi:4-phospho-D-threonate 3-dehydrogenase / 4-phospho-D-erythronate 3-dehydrogenase
MRTRLPRVGITLGDPAGIGPEIAVRTLQEASVYDICTPILFGSPDLVERTAATLGLRLDLNIVDSAEAELEADVRTALIVPTSGAEAVIPPGQVSAAGGEAAVAAVRSAVNAAMGDDIQAVCTAPLNKESMRQAGFPYDGHTEMLAEFTGSSAVCMLLLGDRLRVAHLTTHTSIRSVPDKVTTRRITEVARIAVDVLSRVGINEPRIALSGLNPHAGENGLFGAEELDAMVPAIEQLQAEGLDIRGPVSPDAVFLHAMDGQYDLVIVPYHDQGHVPVKLIEREKAVNVTGGLPIVRTSVDHGTAFDIAGKGIASIVNMQAAINVAALLSSQKGTLLQ